jgi:hypothetical protein
MTTEPAPPEDGEEFDGGVYAVFRDEAARVAVDRLEAACSGWGEVAVWNGDVLKLRATERDPAALLAKLERAPGFVCGWWQAATDGTSAMIEGDVQDHALDCLRSRNATGLANCLGWLRGQRVHLHPDLVVEAWPPGPRHRLARPQGSWWEWFDFTRQASRALRGGRPSMRYLRAERDRLYWAWTHGGSRAGWPASVGEALERTGLRREAPNRWAR